ncbi:putative Signal transduction histidine kinase [Vibrio nigripulchritudo SOn1]|uniref:histidine kinase n=1 Tax=Vibrio nigripulchritudo SOn1 TaxID=1238450 RepID=A0AAV2VNI9_9VIBR|nr:HAMP domain-containing sensor histidine kinase [Vibrio nigripulchritudo]CCO46016.1 putative Signal transduction histidine kinase [Vibrio nigripulchritudo SOn1]
MQALSISEIKRKLIRSYSFIAFGLTALIYLSLAAYLILSEDRHTAVHLESFKELAIERYQDQPKKFEKVSPFIKAYFSETALPKEIRSLMPFPVDEISSNRNIFNEGYFIFHTRFLGPDGKEVPLFMTIAVNAKDFGDESWDFIFIISMVFTGILVLVLQLSLKKMFRVIMRPISELSNQLSVEGKQRFTLSNDSILELEQLTEKLNQFSEMKERVAKQELMFAKYASHELKTPIAIILGAANLQGMKEDHDFREKQRGRIIKSAKEMQATVEVLLSIVKQENAGDTGKEYGVSEASFVLEDYQNANSNLDIQIHAPKGTSTNLPPSVLSMILKNLVDNAVRHTESGEINVAINHSEISVQDTGIGLTGNTTTEHGLGLLIVRRLCESYGWAFSIQNHPNGGCIARMNKHCE